MIGYIYIYLYTPWIVGGTDTPLMWKSETSIEIATEFKIIVKFYVPCAGT